MIATEELRFICVLATQPSLASAARALNVTAPAVSQRLLAIERRLGVRLVNRSTRQLTLTDEGELMEAEGRIILSRLDRLEDDVAQRRGDVVGRLRVLAPMGFGRSFIAPALSAFREKHPRAQVELTLSDRLGRHPTQNWDVSIHIGELEDSSMYVQKLAPNARFACASPDYIRQRGMPQNPTDLLHHECIALRENDEDVTLWRFGIDEKPNFVRVAPVLASNDGDVVRDWALAGRGIMVRSEWNIADDLREGRLVRVLTNYTLPDADVVALFGTHGGGSGRVKAFIDHLTSRFRPIPWRVGSSPAARSSI